MDQEDRDLMEEVLELSRENNKILHKLHRAAIIGRIGKIIYWVVIIGSMFGVYYFFQPLVENLMDTYNSVLGGFSKTQDVIGSLPGLNKLGGGE